MSAINNKPLIYDLGIDELKTQLAAWGEAPFRANQIWQGLYQHLWTTSDEFTMLSQALRQKLDHAFAFSAFTPARTLSSSDGETVKTLLSMPDDRAVEAVLMRYEKRNTLCISTQSGCAIGCVFCATGQMGFKRNLTPGEIVAQVLYYARKLRTEGEVVTNVVLMGMGEPFLNYDATIKAIDRLNDPNGMNLGERRFTISTVGILPGIKRFTSEKRQINLAISLHAANDKLRTSLIPVNSKYPLSQLMNACREYLDLTNRRVSFEWALIEDVNDSPEHARELAKLIKGMLCHVNLILLNPTRKYEGKATSRQRAYAFKEVLDGLGIPCTIRLRRGIDIQAGCGQLAIEAKVA